MRTLRLTPSDARGLAGILAEAAKHDEFVDIEKHATGLAVTLDGSDDRTAYYVWANGRVEGPR